jgi:glycosyltransferase involved in cell wall biosynthesis
MKKLHVLLVVRHPVGGIRTFFRYVYRYFDADKYQFTLIAPDVPEVRVLMDDLSALDLTYVPVPESGGAKKLANVVTRVVWRERFDLIHSHGFTSGVCSALGALTRRTPHLLTCHDVFTPDQFAGLSGWVKRLMLSGVFATVDRIHCVSHDARSNLLDYLPLLRIRKDRIVAIRNGIEVIEFTQASPRNLREELNLPRECLLIGFLGRFMSQKGFRYLVDAVDELKRVNLSREVFLLCFGYDGFIREEQAEILRRGLGDTVKFLPFVPGVASTIKGLDIVAMPSLWEACGLLAMETMVSGVPLIGTNCVGLREILEDTPAHLVPPRNSEAILRALRSEIEQPTVSMAKEFSATAAKRFDVRSQAEDLQELMLATAAR